jgi:hypothetical protein
MPHAHPYWVVFGDVHGRTANLRGIPELAGAAGVIVTGDLTNRGGVDEAQEVIESLAAINPRILAQIGNMDLAPVQDWLDDQGRGLHLRAVELVPGLGVMGVGWSGLTPFHTPSEVPDFQLASWLDETYEKARHFKHLILASHTPPHGSKTDVAGSGAHVGSRAVREFIERVQPDLCLTGHIHESRSVDRIGDTVVVNPGDLASGGYVLVSFDGDSLTTELMDIGGGRP